MRKFIAVTIFVCLNMQGMKRKRGVENTPSRPITRAYKKKCIDLEKAYSKILPVWEAIPAVSNEHRKITFHPGFKRILKYTLNKKPDKVMRYDNYVYSVAYSPDGTQLASGEFDSKIKLWDLDGASSDPVREFDHGGWVNSIVYSPDGRQLASGGWGNSKIKLWDVDGASSDPVREFDHGGWVDSIAYGPDGRRLASGGYGTVKLWDLASSNLVREFDHGGWVRSIAYSSDGRQMASGGGGTVKLWDLASSNLVREFDHGALVRSIAYSPDGKKLASGGDGYQVKLWNLADVDSSGPVWKLDQGDFVSSIAYSPDGKQLASSSDDKIKLWNIAERIQFSNRLKGKRDHLSCAQYDLLKAIQEVYLLHKFAQARKDKPIDPIELDSPYTHVFKSFPRCIQNRLERYVRLYKTTGYKGR